MSEAVRERLAERYQRVASSPWRSFKREVKYLVDFINGAPSLRSICTELERSVPSLDPETWAADNFTGFGSDGEFEWPDSEEARAKVCWHLMKKWAAGEEPESYGYSFGGASGVGDAYTAVTEAIVGPWVAYLADQLSQGGALIHVLARYARVLEWFDAERLYAEFLRDTSKGEAVYDAHFRRFLFEQGIDFPFSQPVSPSGRADSVALVESDEPLVCEIKVYDGLRRNVAWLAKGAHQAYRYARDYQKPIGYLLTVNVTDEVIRFPSDGERALWPPRLHVGDKTVFFIVAQGKPQAAASGAKTTPERVIAREDLVTEIEGSD